MISQFLKLPRILQDHISKSLGASASLVLSAPRWLKLSVVCLVDIQLCIASAWIAFYLRLGEFVDFERLASAALLSILVAIPVFVSTGLYRIIFRYSGWLAIKAATLGLLVYALIYSSIIMIYTLEGVPRTIGALQPLVLFITVVGSRLFARFWLDRSGGSGRNFSKAPRAMIYGAGLSGRQLVGALRSGRDMSVVGFIDDDTSLQGRFVNGIKVFAPDRLGDLFNRLAVTHILMALPSASRTRRHQIVNFLSRHHVVVRTLPALADIAGGRITVNDIKDLDVDDLLNRDPVDPDPNLLRQTVKGKTVLVTGAGGSIGQELCRQIISLEPKALVLVEFNEYALYSIHDELERHQSQIEPAIRAQVSPVLCSIQDRCSIRQILAMWKPDTIYHAAAFKHVPLVEYNIREGFKNNVFGTLIVAQSAIEANVANLVLVSTDKAVRPTNVMGATKRLAEMILQALSREKISNTCMSMVRFGNVLGSSGSVIPRFQEQIRSGGPVTVTHPDVTRYFMTIPEAAQLVLQAAAISRGAEVFVLDMGVPVKIVDLARRMIALSGLSERTLDNPEGDIEIVFTGLRPGEKLFEELLIGEGAVTTVHSQIMQADEQWMKWRELKAVLNEAHGLIEVGDEDGLLNILNKLVDGFDRAVSRSEHD